jgi:hypothetical protein
MLFSSSLLTKCNIPGTEAEKEMDVTIMVYRN